MEAALRAKGADRRFAGEDWVATVGIQARTIRALLATLESIRDTGRVPIRSGDVSVRPDGQVVVRVNPMDQWDRVLFPGWVGEIWLDPEVGIDDLDDHLGSFYTKAGVAEPGVGAVLGAGNVGSIAPLDALHKLFVDGTTVIVKFNPVNEYIGPIFEEVFGDLIEEGFVRTAYGGSEVGFAVAHHPLVTEVHLTGSARTLEALVYGMGPDGAARRAAGQRLLDKPVTSELGNVTPVIVVPGPWRDRDLRFQAEHLATHSKQNDGFTCNAAQVLVLHDGWELKEPFLRELRRVLGRLPARPAYYPGAEERWRRFADSHREVEYLGPVGPGQVPATLLLRVDPDSDHLAFREESFCAVTATVELGGDDAAGFLQRAVEFSNDRLSGDLSASVLVDPATAAELGDRLDAAIAGLRYGATGINVWTAASYGLGTAIWGGYPDHTDGTGSGSGFVHNGRLVDRPQRSVVAAPFRQFPKPAWFVTHRNATRALRRFAEFEAKPGLVRLLRTAAAVLRG